MLRVLLLLFLTALNLIFFLAQAVHAGVATTGSRRVVGQNIHILISLPQSDRNLYPTYRACIASAANEWARHGNFSFTFAEYRWPRDITTRHDGMIFINQATHLGHYTGSADVNNLPFSAETIHLKLEGNSCSTRWRSLILHEFGHFLGLEHEHQHPDVPDEIHARVVQDLLSLDNQGAWRNRVTRDARAYTADDENHFYTPYDPDSIMHYGFKIDERLLNHFWQSQPPSDTTRSSNQYRDIRSDTIIINRWEVFSRSTASNLSYLYLNGDEDNGSFRLQVCNNDEEVQHNSRWTRQACDQIHGQIIGIQIGGSITGYSKNQTLSAGDIAMIRRLYPGR